MKCYAFEYHKDENRAEVYGEFETKLAAKKFFNKNDVWYYYDKVPSFIVNLCLTDYDFKQFAKKYKGKKQ